MSKTIVTNRSTTATTVEFARYAHSLGLCVIPAHPGTKRPCVKYEYWIRRPYACPSIELVERWWSRWPDANVLILLGPNSGGLSVLDFDDLIDYRTWEKAKPELANWLVTVQTRDGRHVYFRQHGDQCLQSADLRQYGVSGELKSTGTLVLFTGSVSRFDKQGNEIDPHVYSFVNEPTDEGFQAINLVHSGLVPDGFVSSVYGIESSPKPNSDKALHKSNTALHSTTQHTPAQPSTTHSVPPTSNSIEFDVLEFVNRYPLSGGGQRNSTGWRMAVSLNTRFGGSVPVEVVDGVFGAWWQLFGSHSGTDQEDAMFEFQMQCVRADGGVNFTAAVMAAMQSEPLPAWAKLFGRDKWKEVCRAISAADRVAGGGVFFLSARTIAELSGFGSHSQALQVVKYLCSPAVEVVQLVERGCPAGRKANTYRLLVDSNGDEREKQQ